jgi:hypothetical protein
MEKLIDYSNALMMFTQKLGKTPDVLRANFVWVDGITIASRIEDEPRKARALYIPDPDLVKQNPQEYFKPQELRMRNESVLAARIEELDALYNVLKLSGA